MGERDNPFQERPLLACSRRRQGAERQERPVERHTAARRRSTRHQVHLSAGLPCQRGPRGCRASLHEERQGSSWFKL